MTDTTLTLPMVKIMMPRFPNRRELQASMIKPSVMIALIICGTLLALAAIAGVVFLAYTGNDTAVIGTLIVGVLTALGVLLNSRMKQTLDAVQKNNNQE